MLFYQLDELLNERMPNIAALFRDSEIETSSMYASDWVLNLFTSCDRLPLRVVLGVWDHFVLRGWSVLFSVSVQFARRPGRSLGLPLQ